MPRQTGIECGQCDDGEYIKYEGTVRCCNNCHYSPEPGPQDARLVLDADEFTEWQEHRRNNPEISGWYGHDRIKFVGAWTPADYSQ